MNAPPASTAARGRRIARVCAIGLVALGVGYLGWRNAHRLWPRLSLRADHQRELSLDGSRALTTRDVPVAALLLLGDSVIGRGWNTVHGEGDAGGHAEINAMSDALKRIGWDTFRTLDRERLWMITTFEPCAMCKGALIEYRIDRVAYVKGKPLPWLLREDLHALRYQLHLERIGDERLQDSLFHLHPDHPRTD